jgi:hypothetical protein
VTRSTQQHLESEAKSVTCSEPTLTGESWFHKSTPLGIEPGSLMTGSCVSQVGLSHCRHDGLVTVRDEARLRRGHNDQSRRGHQCSEITLTEESRVHISTLLGIEPRPLMTGSKGLTHSTSETVYECSEIAGSPQTIHIFSSSGNKSLHFM